METSKPFRLTLIVLVILGVAGLALSSSDEERWFVQSFFSDPSGTLEEAVTPPAPVHGSGIE